jgi:hypothetical protein
MAEGDDPAFLVVKTLDLDLTVNGEQRHLTGTDPDTINLAPATIPSRRAVTMTVGKNGDPVLETREAGKYACMTASGKTLRASLPAATPAAELVGPWQVRFAPRSGSPIEITLQKLISWTKYTNMSVKYYSGEATYVKSFVAPHEILSKSQRVNLDLGNVQVMARVTLNGKDLGTCWKPPFRVDVTGIVAPGENHLEVRVVNLWPNRLIGDEQLPEDSDRNPDGTLKNWPAWLLEGKPSPAGRQTFVSWRLWKKTDALLDSGLIGPVRLEAVSQLPLR